MQFPFMAVLLYLQLIVLCTAPGNVGVLTFLRQLLELVNKTFLPKLDKNVLQSKRDRMPKAIACQRRNK